MQITNDRTVTLEYAARDDQGTVLDNSRASGPLSYIHGKGKIVSGLETALEGKRSGDNVTVTLTPEQGYGQRDESRLHTFTQAELSELCEIKLGMQLQTEDDSGKRILTVTGIEDDKVILDENHPLAGKTVTFSIHIVSVRDATDEELQSGQAYDVACHDDCSSCASNAQYDDGGGDCGCSDGCGHH